MPDNALPPAPVASPAPTPAPSTDLGSAGSPAADATLESSIDSLLAAPSPAAETPTDAPETAPVAPAEGATPQVAAPAATPAEVKPTEATPEAAKPAPDEDPDSPDDDLDQAQADEAKPQNLLDLKRPRGQRIYGGYKAFKGITEAVGHEMTPDEAVAAVQAYSDRLAMEEEFTSTDPSAQVNWLNHWQQQDPVAMARIAGHMPQVLAQNQPAYNAAAYGFITRYLNNVLYPKAASEADPEVKAHLLHAAQMLDFELHGKYRPAEELPKPPDRIDMREAALAAREQQILGWDQQAVQSRQYGWAQQLADANNSALQAEVGKAVAPLKDSLSARQFQAAQRDFEEAVRSHIAKDVEGGRIYDIQLSRSLRSLDQQGQQALAGQFGQRVSRAVKAVTPGFLKEWGVAAKAQSEQRHQALAAAAEAGKTPASTGAPVQQSIMPSPGQYASKGEQMAANIDQLLGVKGGPRF